MEYSGKNRVAKIEFYWHEVRNRVLSFHGTTTLDDSCFEQHTFGKRGLAATFGANERDVFNFVGLINSHIKAF